MDWEVIGRITIIFLVLLFSIWIFIRDKYIMKIFEANKRKFYIEKKTYFWWHTMYILYNMNWRQEWQFTTYEWAKEYAEKRKNNLVEKTEKINLQ